MRDAAIDGPLDAALGEAVWAQTRRPLPHPGAGRTAARLESLAALGMLDLCLAKLVEPHHDATAILADLRETPPAPDSLWAVWAAEPPTSRLTAAWDGVDWRLSGRKAFCSGASLVTHALVTAHADDGARLFAVAVGTAREEGSIGLAAPDWIGAGMQRADTRTLHVDSVLARPVGGPGAYLQRSGFWHGGAGIAACWLGGARGVAATLVRAAQARDLGPHVAAHVGAVTAALDAATAHLHAAGAEMDEPPDGDADSQLTAARRSAESVRATVAAAVDEVVERTARALGPAPLAFDAAHTRRVDDLRVFVRQHHAERDLAELGRLIIDGARVEGGAGW